MTFTAVRDLLCVCVCVQKRCLPLFRCEVPLVLSLKPWLRLFPAAAAALTEPLAGMSLPAVDTLAEGPGSLMEGGKKRGHNRTTFVSDMD